jgi:hypothetical protein
MQKICDILPDHPEKLNAYLNIHQKRPAQNNQAEQGRRKHDEF